MFVFIAPILRHQIVLFILDENFTKLGYRCTIFHKHTLHIVYMSYGSLVLVYVRYSWRM